MLSIWPVALSRCSTPPPPNGCTGLWRCAASWWTLPPGIGTSWRSCGCTCLLCCYSLRTREDQPMADVAVQHGVEGLYEPSLFGTYSKKIGMWLFLLSDSLTFGALLFAYSYGRISTPNWPTPFHSASIVNATIMTAFLLTSSLTMVFAVRASADGNSKLQRLFLLATMACGVGFMILHAREWHNLIREGLTLSAFPAVPGQEAAGEFADVAKSVPQFPATFFG